MRMKRNSMTLTSILFLLVFKINSGCQRPPSAPQDNESAIHQIGHVDVGTAYDVAIEGNLACVTCNGQTVFIDVDDPVNPIRKGDIPIRMAFGVTLRNDTAYIAGERFLIVDLANSEEPEIVGEFTGRSPAQSVCLRENHCFLAYYDGGLEIVCITNPGQPQSIGYLDVNERVLDVSVCGNHAYLSSPEQGLLIIDVTDPTRPQLIHTVSGTAGAWCIYIEQNRLFLGCHGNGIRILDISDPLSPSVIGSYSDGGEVYGVYASGNRLYVADLQEGVKVLDISDPTHPHLREVNSDYAPHSIFNDDSVVFIGDQDDGFVVLDVSGMDEND